jgi:hypothetical protein
MARELELVKTSLLYGDKTILLSPITTMLLRVEALAGFSLRQHIKFIREVAPYILESDRLDAFDDGVQQVDDFLGRDPRQGTPADRLLRAKLLARFEPTKAAFAKVVTDLSAQTGIDQLAVARSRGLVEVDSADPGTEIDLLASCVIAAKLAETGQTPPESHTHRIVETFVSKLWAQLASGRDYLVFDDAIASLVEAAVREGVVKPAKGPASRLAQAMTASTLMARLPTFPGATVDEVLDIREALSDPLIRFRAAMVTLAKTFTSEAWERDFDDEVHNAWVETVHPAVQSIEMAVREDRSLLARASGFAGAAKAGTPGLAIVGAAVAGHLPALADAGAAMSTLAPLLDMLRQHRKAGQELRMQPFYFLYALDQDLGSG